MTIEMEGWSTELKLAVENRGADGRHQWDIGFPISKGYSHGRCGDGTVYT